MLTKKSCSSKCLVIKSRHSFINALKIMSALIRSLYNLTPAQRGGVITIGNFDGVHRGHQQLVKHVIEQAKTLHVPSLVVTFEPHPFEFFSQNNVTIPRLTRLREKVTALFGCGVDNILILPFNQPLADKPARDFVRDILHHALRPVHIVIGDDFHFGYQRQGNFSLLQNMGMELGFSVEAMPTVLVDGERVSSTRVRKALVEDDQALVKQLLGHSYSMSGRIRMGDQRGRQWGFPTANLFLHRKLAPVRGVYAVYMHGVADKPWPGVANIGLRPTVDGTRALLEVHLLNFNQEIYGRYVQVEFCKKLRDEVRFANVDLLKQQIASDVAEARNYFEKYR
jgi:riboflavin kinase/FMN adenylyltransferase